MILAGFNRIDELENKTVDFDYHKVEESEKWRIGFVQELIDVKFDELQVPGMEYGEMEQILGYLCAE